MFIDKIIFNSDDIRKAFLKKTKESSLNFYDPDLKINALNVTLDSSCNLSCDYCFSNANHKKKLKQDKLNKLYDRIHNFLVKYRHLLNNPKIILSTDGEILLYKKLIRKLLILSNHLKRKFLFQIQTNGTLIDNSFIQILNSIKKSGNYYRIIISFDFLPKINDIHRVDIVGKGTSKKILKSILLLEQNNISYDINSVLVNPEEVSKEAFNIMIFTKECFKLLNRISVTFLFPSGRKKNYDNNSISQKYFDECYSAIATLSEYFNYFYQISPLFFGEPSFHLCNLHQNFSISPQTKLIFSCPTYSSLPNKNNVLNKIFSIGSFEQSNIPQINKKNLQKMKSYSKEYLEEQYNSDCLDCEVESFCHFKKCSWIRVFPNYCYKKRSMDFFKKTYFLSNVTKALPTLRIKNKKIYIQGICKKIEVYRIEHEHNAKHKYYYSFSIKETLSTLKKNLNVKGIIFQFVENSDNIKKLMQFFDNNQVNVYIRIIPYLKEFKNTQHDRVVFSKKLVESLDKYLLLTGNEFNQIYSIEGKKHKIQKKEYFNCSYYFQKNKINSSNNDMRVKFINFVKSNIN